MLIQFLTNSPSSFSAPDYNPANSFLINWEKSNDLSIWDNKLQSVPEVHFEYKIRSLFLILSNNNFS